MTWDKRVEHTSRVWRQLPKDVYSTNTDIHGHRYKLMSGCNLCNKMKPLAEFYVRTDRAEGDPNAVYKACIPCYDNRKKNGSAKEQRRRSANTLELFFD
jgi:hypothetical protein